MSDISIGKRGSGNPFGPAAIALMLALGSIGFIGLLVLGAFAPDMRSGRNGGAHALSNAATGFSALVELARATGRNPRIVRNAHEFDTESLLIVTPEHGYINITPVTEARPSKPTLFILPKWLTKSSLRHTGWVDRAGTLPVEEPIGVLAPGITFTMEQRKSDGKMLQTTDLPKNIQFRAPATLQVITGFQKPEPVKQGKERVPIPPAAAQGNESGAANYDGTADAPKEHKITPLITDGRGGTVLAQIDDGPLFVLADPDLLSNLGMKDIRQAASALALLDALNSNPPDSVAFDVSLNGFGHSKSPLKLLFEPPFLAATISIAAALLLAGIQAFGRFGAPRRRERAIAFGKAALVDNSAALIRKAGREGSMGGRYAAIIRERAVAAFAIPPRLRDGALDAYLDALKGKRHFTDLAAAAEAAEDRETMLAAAQALHNWQKEKTG